MEHANLHAGEDVTHEKAHVIVRAERTALPAGNNHTRTHTHSASSPPPPRVHLEQIRGHAQQDDTTRNISTHI